MFVSKGLVFLGGGVVFGKVPARGMEAQREGTCMYLMEEDKYEVINFNMCSGCCSTGPYPFVSRHISILALSFPSSHFLLSTTFRHFRRLTNLI
jgi:hypothetical protein